MINTVHVFDCDGVLVDSTHRYRAGEDGKIDLQYWRDNQPKAYQDTLLPTHDKYLELLQDPTQFVVIATAREMNAPDWQFFDDKLMHPQHFIYRQPGDCRGGAIIKVAGLNKLLSLRQFEGVETMHVYEDNHNYLKGICDSFADRFTVHGHYVPSKQGH